MAPTDSSHMQPPVLFPLQPLKPISISLTSKSKPQVNRKRPHSSLASPESDSDPEVREYARPQAVLLFDRAAGGAISANHSDNIVVKAPLVIPKQSNRKWREDGARRRGKNLLPAEVQALRNGEATEATTGGGNKSTNTYGLTFISTTNTDYRGDVVMVDSSASTEVNEETMKEKTADEEAMEALLERGKKSDLVLPAVQKLEDESWQPGQFTNEDDQFRLDVASRPDSASLEAYTAVPVEEFGAGLLRGMGWKEGDVIGKRKDLVSKPIVKERRPALLGIGAKGSGVELEAWGMGKGKKGMDIKTYNPVMLKNTKTGEMLTEQELKKRFEDQKMFKEDDWKARRDRNLANDRESKRGRERSQERRGGLGRREEERRRSRRREYEDGDRSERKERERRRRDDDDYERKDRDRRRKERYEDRDGRRDEEYRHRERGDTRHRGRQEVF